MSLQPLRLVPSFREKIWGATALEPWFRDSDVKIGEVWFTADDNRTEDGRTLVQLIAEYGTDLLGGSRRWDSFPILVKFLFTTDRLSVQVHPDDRYARAHENFPGKTEMWYALRSEPGGSLALGFREPLSRDHLRRAAVTGEIESLLRWFPVRPGDAFFTPAGTVHAIGSGLTLVEIQENSDLTYRLYDYGRPRELHLDKALAVADPVPHPGTSTPTELGCGRRLLAYCEHFATESLDLAADTAYPLEPGRMDIVISVEGAGSFGSTPFGPGEVWLVPATAAPFEIKVTAPVRLLRTYVPTGT